jgi:hypothetical protein
MGYSAGNLELSILGFSDKAVASVDVTTKALRRLASAVKLIGKTNFTQAGLQLNYIFKEIANSTNQINTQNIEHLAAAAKSLASISRLSNLEKMDFEKVGNGFNTLSVAIQPFLDKVKEAEASLTALDGVLRRSSGKKIQGLLGGGATDNKKGGFLGFAKLGISIYMMRRLGRFIGNLVQAGSDYNETLNLWQVAMRNNLDVADQFVNKMQKAYGISTKTLMNAQAIFKNMIGSLGQISDATAYALSEALVQMSADFASLYNVTIESAFEKMQSMLAGQVRPIRSAGLDMTETTLFMFYQQLGGTKTMRQLNRTEKQLLSILAVYEQMGKAGALGDMTKTLNQFANQARMMTEYWTELKTWTGLVLKDLIDQSGALIYINAALITMTEVVKAIAKSRGLGDENFLTGMFETAEATNDAVDELQGKLLDFDKFRSLEGANGGGLLSIDEKLLDAIADYSSKIDQAQNSAKKLAETWLEWWIAKDGGLTTQAKIFLEVLELIGATLAVLVGASMIASVAKLGKVLGMTGGAMGFLIIGFGTLLYGVMNFISHFDELSAKAKVWIPILSALAGVLTAVAVAIWSPLSLPKAIGIGAMVAGAALAVSTAIAIPNYENGASDIDSGTVFRAGEFGKTEAVYTGSNGKTNVANVKQMEQAFYNALSRYGAEDGGKIVVEAYLDGEKVYQNTTAKAKARGKVWANA